MNTRLLRLFWQRILGRAWIVSLVLFVALGGLRAYGVFGPSSARLGLVLSVLLMWFLPFIFFTKEGRQAMGVKKVAHPRWLGWGLFLGMGASLIVFWIGWVLYGRSAENWYISVLASFSIGAAQLQIPRFVLFLLYTLPAMIFSPIGEEFFFRGMLHESVKEQWGTPVATLVNAIAFGVIHLLHHGFRWDSTGGHLLLGSALLWVGLMMGLSWIFTVCRQRSGSIWPAVVAHSGFNLVMNVTIFWILL
jgi:membrane protease YdiL (CAAX protease family)